MNVHAHIANPDHIAIAARRAPAPEAGNIVSAIEALTAWGGIARSREYLSEAFRALPLVDLEALCAAVTACDVPSTADCVVLNFAVEAITFQTGHSRASILSRLEA